MAQQLTADDARISLTSHVAAKGAEICARFGPGLGWTELQILLNDRAIVRYPCTVKFDTAGLQPGEFAHPVPNGGTPEDGYTMYVHPIYLTQLAQVPCLVLYQLVVVNYGEFASHEDAEVFAAAALGLGQDDYYRILCELADQLGVPSEAGAAEIPSECSGGCSCSHG
ncbi:MAG: hypothetical protein ACHQ5A_08695 [Opitutales bacterium]